MPLPFLVDNTDRGRFISRARNSRRKERSARTVIRREELPPPPANRTNDGLGRKPRGVQKPDCWIRDGVNGSSRRYGQQTDDLSGTVIFPNQGIFWRDRVFSHIADRARSTGLGLAIGNGCFAYSRARGCRQRRDPVGTRSFESNRPGDACHRSAAEESGITTAWQKTRGERSS